MHLKNFSLLTDGPVVELSPAYDLVNTSIALHNPREEIALPIKEKKRNLSKKLFFEYYANERLGLTEKTIALITADIQKSLPTWQEIIKKSFLSNELKEQYKSLLLTRATALELKT